MMGELTETMKLSMSVVLRAVRSLYDDELKPFGRILLKRIREQASQAQASSRGLPVDTAEADAVPRVDPRRLRRLCEKCTQLCVCVRGGEQGVLRGVGRARRALRGCLRL